MCRHILAEYQGDRLFNKVVNSVKQTKNLQVVVTCADGSTYRARRAICTIPLNCISGIIFDPPLLYNKQVAVRDGHIELGEKYHISLDEPQGNWFANTCDKNSSFLFGIKYHKGSSKPLPLDSNDTCD
jgi:monoamine oxidase